MLRFVSRAKISEKVSIQHQETYKKLFSSKTKGEKEHKAFKIFV